MSYRFNNQSPDSMSSPRLLTQEFEESPYSSMTTDESFEYDTPVFQDYHLRDHGYYLQDHKCECHHHNHRDLVLINFWKVGLRDPWY